jgi:hypothetical protein
LLYFHVNVRDPAGCGRRLQDTAALLTQLIA